MKSEIIINQVLDENIIGAKETIKTLLIQKAKVFLEDKRRCLASISYGPCAEASGSSPCSCDEVQAESNDCGCNKVEEEILEGVGAYTLKKTKVEKNEVEPDYSDEVQTIVYYDIMLDGKKVGQITWEEFNCDLIGISVRNCFLEIPNT